MTLAKANVCCSIVNVIQDDDGAWQVTVDVSIKTTSSMFFDEKCGLLGTLPATVDSINLDRLLRMLAMEKELKKEVSDAIEKEKVRWKK